MWVKKPYKENVGISSPFGERKHPITKEERSFHKGIDAPLTEGTALYAPLGGKILNLMDNKGLNEGYGRYQQLWSKTEQGTVIVFIFAHLSWYYAENGSVVKAGDKIALTGNTGASTGAHLHFEVNKYENNKLIPLDPGKYVDFSIGGA